MNSDQTVYLVETWCYRKHRFVVCVERSRNSAIEKATRYAEEHPDDTVHVLETEFSSEEQNSVWVSRDD